MVNDEITIREWIKNFNSGAYDNNDFETMCKAGWYDWFCKDSSLQKRLQKMGNIIKDITNDYILDNYYVWFKNNCPMVGPLYDDIRFEPLNKDKRDTHYFMITVDDKRQSEKYEFITARNNYRGEAMLKNKRSLVKFINTFGDEIKNS